MFSIALIHKTGGSFTVIEKTLATCRSAANRVCSKFPNSYIACTIPFAIYRHKHGDLNPYDATIPFEIKKGLSLEIRLTLIGED
jgi:hypothetical protein